MLSLNNRPLNVSNGTLLVSLSDGRIQVWSHHRNAECSITDFNAAHVAGDVSKWLIDVHFTLLFSIFLTFFSRIRKISLIVDEMGNSKNYFCIFILRYFGIQMRQSQQ